jgi:hypothetical protein
MPMDRERDAEDLPSNGKEIAHEAEKNRKEMDEIPPPGTDPLHEGP